MRKPPAAAAALAIFAACGAWSASALAQGFGGPPSTAPSPSGPAPGSQPATSAASGLDDDQKPQSQEPTLPDDPLAMPGAVRARIGTGAPSDPDRGKGETTKRRFYGLYYSEESGDYRFKTLFPLYAERETPNDSFSLYTPFYFRQRSADFDADVLFPFAWNLRKGDVRTTILGPALRRTSPGKPARGGAPAEPAYRDTWVAPFVFHGSSSDGGGYLHLPPLLTFTAHTPRDGFSVVGPVYCKWKGGPACDTRTADAIDYGVAPFYFYGKNTEREFELIPPLLHYYRYRDKGDHSFNLWGPLLWEKDRTGNVFNVMPFFWRNWGKDEDHITLFPFFHYGYKGKSHLLATPLFVEARGENGEQTFASLAYSRYRGRTSLDMVTPLFWKYRDPDIDLDRTVVFPFYYRNTSPRSNDIAVFPFYGRFTKPAISDTIWVTPFFRHTRDLTGWETDLYPFFYAGTSNKSTHLVAAPFFFDFAKPKSRATVAVPFFFRFKDQETTSQLALNTYYHEKKVRYGKEWEFHFFPFFSYGETPTGHWWNFLYGLAGYTRDGRTTKARIAYLPFTLSGEQAKAPATTVETRTTTTDGDTTTEQLQRTQTR